MRRLFSVLLICLMMVSFSACESEQQEEVNALEQLKAEYARFDPYVELIDALENGDYAAAEEIIAGYKGAYYNSQFSAGSIEEIVIDSSNWNQYFEVKEITQWCKNDLEETTGFITHVCIVLNEEYADCVIADKTEIVFEWEALCSVKNCDVDLDNQIVNFENVFKSNSTTFGDPEYLSGTVTFDGNISREEAYGNHSVAAEIGEIVIVGEYSLNGELKPVCFDYDDTSILYTEGILALEHIED